ncbi:collagen-like protein [Olivibacter sitiensis]|uniref:collagen-like protein n=1 Tax=Olivibacter sitiensis TaxID=376470 RepID=UPI000417F352|nr:collagen-like protein [Olivibacter sitiensis]
MKKLIEILMLALVFSFVASCKKGEQGEPGPPGSKILSGTVEPTASTGNIGDYYLLTSNSNLYGPKTEAGWGEPLNLKGTTGATGSPGTNGAPGAAGNTILSGTTAPASTLGRNGDFYINLSNSSLYGPKTSSGWGTPISLKGQKGDDGNANVSTKIFLPANITWRQTTLFGTNYVTASLNMSEITSDIVNNGAVMVYGGFFWGDPWSALPISYFENSRTVHFAFGVKQGSVTLRMHYSSNAAPTAPGIQFKVVVIKGNAVTSAKNQGVDLNNYNEVVSFFNLSDR